MKKRILLWLCPMLVLFLGAGLYGVWLFNQLGGSIEVILRENYQSVLAAQQMKESSERMDSGLSFALAGEEQRGRELFDGNVRIFCPLGRLMPLMRITFSEDLFNIRLRSVSGRTGRIRPEGSKSWSFGLQLAKCESFFDGNSRAASPAHSALAPTFA